MGSLLKPWLFKCTGYAFLLAASSISLEAMAGVVLKCVTPKSKVGRVCIVKSRLGKIGDRVIIKDKTHRRYWKATGTIRKHQGFYSLVVFGDTREYISRGDYAEIESSDESHTLDWKSSFSKPEFF